MCSRWFVWLCAGGLCYVVKQVLSSALLRLQMRNVADCGFTYGVKRTASSTTALLTLSVKRCSDAPQWESRRHRKLTLCLNCGVTVTVQTEIGHQAERPRRKIISFLDFYDVWQWLCLGIHWNRCLKRHSITSLYTQPHADGKSGEVLLSTRVFWSFTAKCAWGLVLKLKKDHRMAWSISSGIIQVSGSPWGSALSSKDNIYFLVVSFFWWTIPFTSVHLWETWVSNAFLRLLKISRLCLNMSNHSVCVRESPRHTMFAFSELSSGYRQPTTAWSTKIHKLEFCFVLSSGWNYQYFV